MKTKHVVMFSGGASSAWVAKYVIDKYGKDDTILLHTDTLWEDSDNYRFMDDVSNHLGVPITNKADGRNPEQIFFEEMYFGNFGNAPCSKKLKMMQTVLFIHELFDKKFFPVLYFGIDIKEKQRAPRIAYNYKHNIKIFNEGIECRFPLIGEIDGIAVTGEQIENNEIETNPGFVVCGCEPKKEIQNHWGIKLPRMYELGFSHANCGGRCIKGGFAHYRLLFKVWPDRYLEQEEMERKFNERKRKEGKKEYTILRNYKKNATIVEYSLETYRKEILEKESKQMDLFDDFSVPCECIF